MSGRHSETVFCNSIGTFLKEQIVSALAKMKQQQSGDIVIRLATEADAATIGSGILAQECGHKRHANSLHGLGGCIEENRLAVWSQRLRDFFGQPDRIGGRQRRFPLSL
jgi:hypothetical protein